jgi:uncharacterized protein YlxW (UPF0749 family)
MEIKTMTENQELQIVSLLNKCVSGIQNLETAFDGLQKDVTELKTDVAQLKTDVVDLKTGQNRIEKQLNLNNQALNMIAGEQVRMNVRIDDLERATS